MKYEFLTSKENEKVNSIFDNIEKNFKKNILTKLEADFMFFKAINKDFKKHQFDICTNRKEFEK